MQDWRQIAHETKDILTVCLAKAIDRAMIAQHGDNWFSNFAQSDGKEKLNNRIVKPGQITVQDLDLQALLKFLRFRSEQANQVLEHYGMFAGMDYLAMDAQVRQFNALLDRLINDFRNRIEAHSRAADIEKELSGQGMNRIYGYEEAVQDMYKLARIFGDVKDSSGVPYHKRIAQLLNRKKRRKAILWSGVAAAVLAVVLGVTLWIGGMKPQTYHNSIAPVVEDGKVTVQPIDVYYEDGALIAICYVTNGTGQTVSNINIYSFLLKNGQKTLAAADFGLLENTALASTESVKWKFRFPEDTVLEAEGDLSQLKAEIKCSYE